MIVVIGQPVLHATDDGPTATGPAASIARAAAARGAAVQLIGKVGEDPEGEALVLALARDHVGHVAVLRDPARSTPQLVGEPSDVDNEPADGIAPPSSTARLVPGDSAKRPTLDAGDLELGLRYLTEFRVIVLADPLDDAAVRVAADAAGWGAASLIALVADGAGEPGGLPADAIVLAAPTDDAEGAFDHLVGQLAAAIDAGGDPKTAFRELVSRDGWEPAEA